MEAEPAVILANPDDPCKTKSKAAQGKRRDRATKDRRGMIRGIFTWRTGPAPSWNKRSSQLIQVPQKDFTPFQQAVAEFSQAWAQVPASLQVEPSLNQWFAANASFTIPAYFMLDAGGPHAVNFFSIIDFKEIYHAVMGMLLSWLHGEFPKVYTLSAARFHQAQAIPILRQRLAQGMHNDETYVIMLCAMQTDALLGDRKALTAHRRGLEALSQVMTGRLNEFCRSIKPKLDFFVTETTRSPSLYQEVDSRLSKPLHYPTLPYPESVVEMISSLNVGIQDIAYQPNGMSLEMITWWAGLLKWLAQVNSGTPLDSDSFDMQSSYNEICDILERLDPRSAPLERCSCIGIYLHMASLYYRQIVYTSPVFKTLRAEATEIVRSYQPQNLAERAYLIFHGVKIFKMWKTGAVLEQEGLDLLANLKLRFPEVRQWDTLLVVLHKFPFFGPDMDEWRDVWVQGST